jgi:YfiH family protein
VHSAVVIRADQPRPLDEPHRQADAIITDQPGVTLFMRFADCVPIFLYDPRQRAIGLVHAGWKGVLNQVARRAVEAMQAEYHSSPSEIIAAVGPSIGVHHYEVGPELAEQVRQMFTTEADGLLQASNTGGGGVKFDLWNANRLVLESAGVRQVEIAGICTACNPQDWYSHRGEHGKTGRFGAMLALKD